MSWAWTDAGYQPESTESLTEVQPQKVHPNEQVSEGGASHMTWVKDLLLTHFKSGSLMLVFMRGPTNVPSKPWLTWIGKTSRILALQGWSWTWWKYAWGTTSMLIHMLGRPLAARWTWRQLWVMWWRRPLHIVHGQSQWMSRMRSVTRFMTNDVLTFFLGSHGEV